MTREMTDIELVIKIPKEIYKASQIIDVKHEDVIQIPLEVIANGTPLPKWHGKIIDADKLKQKIEMADDDIMEEDWYKLYESVISDIDNAYAIIETDKAEGGVKRK